MIVVRLFVFSWKLERSQNALCLRIQRDAQLFVKLLQSSVAALVGGFLRQNRKEMDTHGSCYLLAICSWVNSRLECLRFEQQNVPAPSLHLILYVTRFFSFLVHSFFPFYSQQCCYSGMVYVYTEEPPPRDTRGTKAYLTERFAAHIHAPRPRLGNLRLKLLIHTHTASYREKYICTDIWTNKNSGGGTRGIVRTVLA